MADNGRERSAAAVFRIARLAVAATALLAVGQARAAAAPELAITFDDLPAHSLLPQGETRVDIAQHIIAALQGALITGVYGFVNAVQLEREPASAPVLSLWRKAGFPLGNHTWSHANLDNVSVDAFETEIARNEATLRSRAGQTDWHWLRFPYLAEGTDPAKRAAVRHYLAGHGYRIAAVTMSFGDYAWNEPYARCVAKGDKAAIAGMERDYLAAAQDQIGRSRAMAKALYGRDIPYVLLMHIGAFDARMAPRLLDLYRKAGFRFVTLPEAVKDPVYREDANPALPARPASLEGRMKARGLPVPPAAFDLASLDQLCR